MEELERVCKVLRQKVDEGILALALAAHSTHNLPGIATTEVGRELRETLSPGRWPDFHDR